MGVTTPEDGVAVAELGAERIGLVLCEDPALTHDGVSNDEAKAIMAALPPNVTVCGLTFSTEPDEIEEMVRTIRPHVLHLTVTPDLFPIKAISKLKQRLPGLQVMQAIAVTPALSQLSRRCCLSRLPRSSCWILPAVAAMQLAQPARRMIGRSVARLSNVALCRLSWQGGSPL